MAQLAGCLSYKHKNESSVPQNAHHKSQFVELGSGKRSKRIPSLRLAWAIERRIYFRIKFPKHLSVYIPRNTVAYFYLKQTHIYTYIHINRCAHTYTFTSIYKFTCLSGNGVEFSYTSTNTTKYCWFIEGSLFQLCEDLMHMCIHVCLCVWKAQVHTGCLSFCLCFEAGVSLNLELTSAARLAGP